MPDTTVTTPVDRVRAGAAWLDTDKPGWAAAINPKTLDLSQGDRCILGQLYGSFRDALTILRRRAMTPDERYPTRTAINMGFNVTDDVLDLCDPDEIDDAFDTLKTAWLIEIGRRLHV